MSVEKKYFEGVDTTKCKINCMDRFLNLCVKGDIKLCEFSIKGKNYCTPVFLNGSLKHFSKSEERTIQQMLDIFASSKEEKINGGN